MKGLTFRLAILAAMVIFVQNLILINKTDGFVSWSNPSGSATNFDWENGGSDANLFGNPTLVGGNTLMFSPSGFRAESLDGVSDSISEQLAFELIAHSGFSFQSISITEYGDYQILGNGSVEASGELSIENLDTDGTLNGPFVTNYYITGEFAQAGLLSISQPDWTYIKIVLQNNLLAITTSQGSIAWIEKKGLGTAIAIRIIPEPATITMLLIGSLAFIPKKMTIMKYIYKKGDM